jgi:uridylate kinase
MNSLKVQPCIVIKLSGELFSNIDATKNVVDQIKTIAKSYRLGLVVGGGNFFRGARNNNELKLNKESAHNIGMLSTIVNGTMLHDFLSQASSQSSILSAFICPSVAKTITQNNIKEAFNKSNIVIFVGGTGNPFFTTDTNAVLRALQIGANEVWKATKVDGVYSADPSIKQGTLYDTISYKEVIDQKLRVIDHTAITLAQEHNLPIRVFNLFAENALCTALKDSSFGSVIQEK